MVLKVSFRISSLAAICLLMSNMLGNQDNCEPKEVLSTLADGEQMLRNILFNLYNHRRFLVKSFLKEDKRKLLNDCLIDEFLFGKKIQDTIQT